MFIPLATAAAVTTAIRGAPGVVLAGGLARRMGGGDKSLREVGGRTILARVIARLGPQCECLVINANGEPQRFASFGLPVIGDDVNDAPGPLGESWPRSIGPRPTGQTRRSFSALLETVPFCPAIWPRV